MAETTTPVNLLFKYGNFSNLASTIDQGTIYFAKDDTANHENNKGYIYYGDPTSGTKNSIIGDGYFLKNNNQFFINRPILNIGTDDIYLQQLGESLAVNGLRIIRNTSNIELVNNIQIDGELLLDGHFLPTVSDTYDLGSTEFLWNNIYGKNIYGELTGNSSTTTKLAASVSINGTAFDGSSAITTANWGTSRTITIKDFSSTNSGTGVSINGSTNYTLTLPSTIKATLDGNSSTATKLQTARKISVHGSSQNFDGSADISFTIRNASASQSGVVSTENQTFKGNKTFSKNLTVNGSTTLKSLSATTGTFSGRVVVPAGDEIPEDLPRTLKEYGGLQIGAGNSCIMFDENKILVRNSDNKLGTLYIRSPIGNLTVNGTTTLQALSATTGTFSGDLIVKGSDCNFAMSGSHISISNSDVDNGRGMIGVASVDAVDSTNGDRAIFLQSYTNNYKAQVVLVSAGTDSAFYPNYIETPSTGKDKVYNKILNLGVSGRAWKNIYASNGTIQTSDIRLKDIQNSSYLNSLIKVYDSLTPIAYKMKNINEFDNYNRIHVGLSSQEVEEKMLENGLTRLDFGGLCVDPVYDDAGNQIDESYSLRYGEFHGLHILKNHQQDERITELENQIANLKTQLELLKLSIGG